MSARYPLDPFALPNGPDIPLSHGRSKVGVRKIMVRLLTGASIFVCAAAVLTLVLFLLVLFSEATRIDAVILDGRTFQKAEFAMRLGDFFMGTAIFSVAVVSFIMGAALSSGGAVRWQVPGRVPESRTRADISVLKTGNSRNV